MFHFYTPWKRPKTNRFLTFSGCIEVELRAKMGYWSNFLLMIYLKVAVKVHRRPLVAEVFISSVVNFEKCDFFWNGLRYN